jgi:hypothetical protein
MSDKPSRDFLLEMIVFCIIEGKHSIRCRIEFDMIIRLANIHLDFLAFKVSS